MLVRNWTAYVCSVTCSVNQENEKTDFRSRKLLSSLRKRRKKKQISARLTTVKPEGGEWRGENDVRVTVKCRVLEQGQGRGCKQVIDLSQTEPDG